MVQYVQYSIYSMITTVQYVQYLHYIIYTICSTVSAVQYVQFSICSTYLQYTNSKVIRLCHSVNVDVSSSWASCLSSAAGFCLRLTSRRFVASLCLRKNQSRVRTSRQRSVRPPNMLCQQCLSLEPPRTEREPRLNEDVTVKSEVSTDMWSEPVKTRPLLCLWSPVVVRSHHETRPPTSLLWKHSLLQTKRTSYTL